MNQKARKRFFFMPQRLPVFKPNRFKLQIGICIRKGATTVKKTVPVFMFITLIISLCACSQQDMENMSTETGDEYAVIVWKDKTYVPYGALSAYGNRGKQIGIVDGDKDYKVYECKGYSSDEWIVTAFPYDAPMLYREIDITDIPDGWQSEYEWNQ